MGVREMGVEGFEELESFRAMVPEAFENRVDKLRGPLHKSGQLLS